MDSTGGFPLQGQTLIWDFHQTRFGTFLWATILRRGRWGRTWVGAPPRRRSEGDAPETSTCSPCGRGERG